MAKFKAPPGDVGIDIGGQYFAVGNDGCITVPDNGYYINLLTPYGYSLHVEQEAKKIKPKDKPE